MPRLFHFSEDYGLSRFEPRAPLARPEVEPLVWAVDEAHAWTYLFPRDCPRVLLWPLPTTTQSDRGRWLGSETERVACIEWRWLGRLQACRLTRYELPAASFQPLEGEDHAWMFVSRAAVDPIAVEPIDDLLAALAEAQVELRLMHSLAPMRGAFDSTVHVSGIRLRNASRWD